MTGWDEETDVIVIGAGSAGLAAALTASAQGLSVVLLEKTAYFGGTTALSGGVLWIPNNHIMAHQGLNDSAEKALTYLKHNIGNRVSEDKLRSFVDNAPRMLELMTSRGFLDVSIFEGFPDYRAETPGGLTGGRSVEPRVFPGSKLGKGFESLRRRRRDPPLVGTMTELRQLASVRSDFADFLKAWSAIPRHFLGRLLGRKYQATGQGLVGWLANGLQQQQVPVRTNHRLRTLIEENGRVSGVLVDTPTGEQRLGARRGVVLAAGGFEHDPALRAEFFGEYGADDYSSGAPGNEGDVVRAARSVGAALDLMDEAWWAPSCLIPNHGPEIVIFERGKPGQIIVSQEGKRFSNESQPYNDFVKAMFDAHKVGLSSLPSYMVFDQTFRDRYPLAGMLPGITPSSYIESGFLKRADTLTALASAAGIDAEGLEATVSRFNAMAIQGVDEDFGRGSFAFDRFGGDPAVSPNCCMAPLQQPPFYAVEIYPGDLGTKGGLLTDEHARVLRDDSMVIEGLYAAGNCSASPMGAFYPGAGGTIGPAMTFGYIAAMHIAGQL